MSDDDEKKKRDSGISRAARNPANHFDAIVSFARDYLIRKIPPGDWVVSGQVYEAFIEQHPNLKPKDKRVMGQVMLSMEREKYIIAGGQSTRKRSHKGTATEWKRTSFGASFNRTNSFFGTQPRYVFRKTRPAAGVP